MEYAELHCVSNFTFLRGASHPEELVQFAAKLKYESIAITDECSLAGIVRAHIAAKKYQIKLIVGSEITLSDGLSLVLLAKNKTGYENLSKLITHGRRKTHKGQYYLTRNDIAQGIPDCIVLWHPKILNQKDGVWLSEIFPNMVWVSVRNLANSRAKNQINKLIRFANKLSLPCLATGNVHMHTRERRHLQDTVTAIRLGLPLSDLGYHLNQNGEHHLRCIKYIASIYPQSLIKETINVSKLCNFSIDELQYKYPNEAIPNQRGTADHLSHLTKKGLKDRFKKLNKNIPKNIIEIMNHEISLIRELRYEHYFLTVYDIVKFAKEKGILCQGRGSAANSVVCFALGITEVDPTRSQLLFERFISKERKEPPDIDIDFEHNRREEVIQYIYQKYGKERAALTAAVVTYRIKSAIRDVGRALKIKNHKIDKLLSVNPHLWWEKSDTNKHLQLSGLDPESLTTKNLIKIVKSLIGFPRHLSQHVGGFVISQEPLHMLVPIENTIVLEKKKDNKKEVENSQYLEVGRTIIQWDKNDLDALNILKIDILALGILSVITESLNLISQKKNKSFKLTDIPPEDPKVYEMIKRADTVGVFQVESRAQMSMLPRLRPNNFYDLVIQIAIVRPGPIQGGMVHPYLKRRQGVDPITYPSLAIKNVLERTLGVPIFQEQIMQIAITAAGFSPGEADQLRRSISGWRSKGNLSQLRKRLIKGMYDRGYDQNFSNQVFNQILGFGEYGFPESHAASFALLVYASAWLKCHEPASFLVALLNSQPMGFYAPAQLIQDAQRHNVNVKPPNLLLSNWDCSLESNKRQQKTTVRLGLRMIKGLSKSGAQHLLKIRKEKKTLSHKELLIAARLSSKDMKALAQADALSLPDGNRRSALWLVSGIKNPIPIFENQPSEDDKAELPELTEGENIVADYETIGTSLRNHPLKLLRNDLVALRTITASHIKTNPNGKIVRTSGIVINRQRPSSGKGVIFITLEDETGLINVIFWPKIVQRYQRTILTSKLMLVEGFTQKESEVINIIARHTEDHSALLGNLNSKSRDFH